MNLHILPSDGLGFRWHPVESKVQGAKMKAKIKHNNDILILSLEGKIDYETQDDACAVINKAIEKNKTDETPKKILVSMKDLQFVGSAGITHFVEQLKKIHVQTDVTPKYIGVKSEFQKIMKAFDEENEFEFFDDENLSRRNGKAIINN
jgi:anti-anti-sigma factor